MNGKPRSPPSANAPDMSESSDESYVRKSQGTKSSTMIIVALVVIVIILAVVAGAYAGGYIGKKASTTPPPATNQTAQWLPACGGSLTAGGSTLVYPLMAIWTADYAGQKCNSTGANGATSTEINYQAVGSGSGVSSLTNGLYIFGASDNPLTTSQSAALKSPVVTFPDAAGAVCVIYNLKVTNAAGAVEPLNLSGAVIADIYQGLVTNWNSSEITALNPGLKIPSTTITVEHRSDGSGTSFAFVTFLDQESTYWKTNIPASPSPAWPTGLGQKGSVGVAGAVAGTTGAIGYDELNYAEEEGANIQYAKVQNPAGNYILPSVADTAYAVDNASNLPAPTGNWTGYSIINGGGAGTYPISTLTYLMIYTDVGTAPAYANAYTKTQATALVDFLWWIVTVGQGSSVGLFYVPLPQVLVSLDETGIGDIMYNGQALVSHAPPST